MKSLPGDGSQEKAKAYIMELEEVEEIEKLLSESPAFKRMIDGIAHDLRNRLHSLVQKDPELKALKNVLARTLGKKAAARQIELEVESYLQSN